MANPAIPVPSGDYKVVSDNRTRLYIPSIEEGVALVFYDSRNFRGLANIAYDSREDWDGQERVARRSLERFIAEFVNPYAIVISLPMGNQNEGFTPNDMREYVYKFLKKKNVKELGKEDSVVLSSNNPRDNQFIYSKGVFLEKKEVRITPGNLEGRPLTARLLKVSFKSFR